MIPSSSDPRDESDLDRYRAIAAGRVPLGKRLPLRTLRCHKRIRTRVSRRRSSQRIPMGKASFTSNPYPKLVLSETDRAELLQLAENLIVEVFPKYESFVVNDKRVVKK
ncbi:hypothetical protein PF007_g12093 [Phytophthora fragariae]|uniref:Uncharacterized protein n=1 Tax=Phytophthora fragariae TaxID=53985 RepID=A0A6A3S4P8_9STRA|nr:hypothetical protein PF007_g12093 [Phytophthora fragariae]KAE9230127.1 hypothetical protein PF004_g10576 [Phytophthora fragariae]